MSVQETRWQAVLDRMFEELRTGSPRGEVYWAQQLAFSPVFFYAVVLAVREDILSQDDREHLRRIVPLTLSLLGALPDGSASKPRRWLWAAANYLSGLPHDSVWRSRRCPTNPFQDGWSFFAAKLAKACSTI